MHYISTGEVRKRYPFESTAKVYLRATQPGSFLTVFGVEIDPQTIFAAIMSSEIWTSIATDVIKDTLKYIYRRVIGEEHEPETEPLKEVERVKSGDLDALTDAIEYSAKRGHTAIGAGASNIILIQGDNNIVSFDHISKRYLEESIYENRPEIRLVSVGSFNVNTKYGRVFDYELQKTVPFTVSNRANPRTIGALGLGLQRYAQGGNNIEGTGGIYIRYTSTMDPNGRVKKYLVHDAFFDLNGDVV